MIDILPVRTPEDLQAVAALFELYAASLAVDLGYQDFASKLATLPGKYAPPEGELVLARGADGYALGCAGLRPLSAAGACEIKRLYVLPGAHGLGLGRDLARAIIGEAARIGYGDVFLDTLPTIEAPISLYGKMGFERVAAYYAPTPEGRVFMRLRLC